MRLLIAGVAALAAIAFAVPSYAQTEESSPAAPAPVPTAKPKAGTAAYCQSLKSANSRSSCLKKLSAKSTPKAPTTTTAKKTKKGKQPTEAAKQPDVGQLSAPATPAPAPSSGTVAVPPLPSKTI